MCTIDALTVESYAPGLLLLPRTSQNAIEKLSMHALMSKIKYSEKVYIFMDFLFWKFMLIFR